MPVNPKFLAARAAERSHRDHAHLRSFAWLTLTRAGRATCSTPLVPFTLRHRLALRLARNAFFCARPVLRGDVFLFLWRLHPLYRAPRFGYESVVAGLQFRRFRLLRLWLALGSLRSAIMHRRLTRFVRQCDLSVARERIEAFLSVADQDLPGAEIGEGHGQVRRSRIAPERNDADNLVDWLMSTYHLSHDEALDLPVAVANQLYRDRLFDTPDAELKIFAPSDLLLSAT
jgi:hypothetical protein